ncbi:MAG: hypothetical protein V7K89_13570 [Nostoc sp.]|uniref:hypothetical protein n=1 Tax=Nostoc sp. TaxID=1180 RepID=UPI002FF998E9
MLQAQDLNLVTLQLSIFTPNISSFAASKALGIVLSKYSQRYDGDVQALPLPEEVPLEIPRIVLQSKDKAYRLEISPARINSLWLRTDNVKTETQEIVDICKEVLEYYIQSMQIEVNRLGLVTIRVHQTQKPATLLSNKFCKPELIDQVFSSSENFEIHNHSIKNIENFVVNVWTRCKSGLIVNNDQTHSALIVEQDLNTLAQDLEDRKFNLEEIKSFFSLMQLESQAILQLYFPNNQIL